MDTQDSTPSSTAVPSDWNSFELGWHVQRAHPVKALFHTISFMGDDGLDEAAFLRGMREAREDLPPIPSRARVLKRLAEAEEQAKDDPGVRSILTHAVALYSRGA
jgi:hypothetical protein